MQELFERYELFTVYIKNNIQKINTLKYTFFYLKKY